MGRRMRQQRVAVGIRHLDGAGADRAAGARLIFDDDQLPELRRQLLEHDPWNDVGRATRAQRHDHPNGLGRPLVGADYANRGERGESKRENQCRTVAHVASL